MTITPSISLNSFNCPHCKVLAQQFWWGAAARTYQKDGHPTVWTKESVDSWIKEMKSKKDFKEVDFEEIKARVERSLAGEVLFSEKGEHFWSVDVDNLWFSKCYHCERVSVWIYNRLVFPASYDAPAANPDMPADVLVDYTEAAQIAAMSPKGAAALLRLAVQRLMPHLGQNGKDLNGDIARLVEKGLDARIQRSLDIVRVIGNHAVHPGQIDLSDDPETVGTLFKVVNVIVDAMISQPKHIEAAYAELPEGARKAIEGRDKPKV